MVAPPAEVTTVESRGYGGWPEGELQALLCGTLPACVLKLSSALLTS